MSIATNNVIAKIAAVVAGLGLVAMSFAYAAPAAKADTASDLQAQITALMAQIAALQASAGSSSSASVTFSKDLTLGSSGADVTALQNWLISNKFAIAAGATGYFGAQTKAAVAAWQASAGISPAAGYFGPISRAKANAAAGGTTGGSTGGTTGSTTGLQGGEGSITVEGNLGDVESDLDESDTENVLGVELTAEDADVMIERVDVDFDLSDATTGESSNLDDYIEEVTLMLDGKKLASMDVSKANEDDNDLFSFRFTGLKGIIREDDTAELYVEVTAVDNIDSGDTAVVLSADIPADGIRAVDGAGISETYVTAGNVTAETFSVGAATTGDLDITIASDSPDAAIVIVDTEDDTNDLNLLSIELEANDQDLTVKDIPVQLYTSESNVTGQVKRVKLMNGSTVLDTVSVTGTGQYFNALFEDVDLDIEEDKTVTLKVVVDLNDQETTTFDNGTTLMASTTGATATWDVEDANGEDVTPDGTATGDTMTFYASGITVTGDEDDNSATDSAFGTGGSEQGDFIVKFDVKAVEEDYYIYKGASVASSTAAGVTYTVYQDGTASTTIESAGFATDELTAANATGDTSDYFLVREGATRSFELRVNINPATTGFYFVELEAVRYDASEDSASTDDSTLTVPDEDEFETDSIQINA